MSRLSRKMSLWHISSHLYSMVWDSSMGNFVRIAIEHYIQSVRVVINCKEKQPLVYVLVVQISSSAL